MKDNNENEKQKSKVSSEDNEGSNEEPSIKK